MADDGKSEPVKKNQEQKDKVSSHTEKRPKHPYGILLFSLWWAMFYWVSNLFFTRAKFKYDVQTNP
jgi:hypothetical protein